MLDVYNAKLICQKITALTGTTSPSNMAKILGTTLGTAKKICRHEARDFQLSLLVTVAEKYRTTIQYVTGIPSVRGEQICQDAYIIAMMADSAIKRARSSSAPSLPGPAITPLHSRFVQDKE